MSRGTNGVESGADKRSETPCPKLGLARDGMPSSWSERAHRTPAQQRARLVGDTDTRSRTAVLTEHLLRSDLKTRLPLGVNVPTESSPERPQAVAQNFL